MILIARTVNFASFSLPLFLGISPSMKRASNSYTAFLSGIASLVVFLWLHPQILTYIDSRFIGGAFGDGGLYVWLTKLFVADPWKALHFETNSFYPYPISRAWSDSFLLPSLMASLLVSLGAQFAVAYNIVILSAIALNGFAASLLASTLSLRPVGAFAVGLMVANSSYFIGNAGHPQLLFFFWIPLAWSAALGSSGALPTASRRWLYAGLCVTGAFYSAVYYAIFASIGLAVIWLVRLFLGQVSQRRALRTLMLATIGASPIVYALRYYLAVQSYFGKRGVYEATAFAASGFSYLAFSPLNDIFGKTSSVTHSEALLCPGYLALAIAVVTAAITAWNRSRPASICLALATLSLCAFSSIIDTSMTSEYAICISSWLVILLAVFISLSARSPLDIFIAISAIFFVLSFGPGGDPTKHEPTFAPFGALYSLVPGLTSIRAVSRFGSVAILGLVIGAVYGCLRLGAVRPRLTITLLSLLTGITLAENSVSTIPLDTISATPQAFDVVARATTPTEAVLALPFGGKVQGRDITSWSDIAILSSQYAQWATDARIQLLNGYSGQRTKLQSELARVTASFPSRESFEYFAKICGLRWIVVTPTLLASWDEDSFMRQLGELSAYTSEVIVSPDKSVAIRLADVAIPISATSDSEGLVLFAPRHAPPRIQIPAPDASITSGPCLITTEIPRKGGTSAGVTFPLSASGFNGIAPSYDPARLLPSSAFTTSRAAPTLLRLSASGCAPRVSCTSR